MIKDLSYSSIVKTLRQTEQSNYEDRIIKKCQLYQKNYIEDNESISFIKRLNLSQLDNFDKKSRYSMEKSFISDPITLIRNKENYNVIQKQLQPSLTLKERIQAKLMARKSKKTQNAGKQAKSKIKNKHSTLLVTNIKQTTFRPNTLKTQFGQEDDLQTCRVLSPYQIMKNKKSEATRLLANSVHLCQKVSQKSPLKQQKKKSNLSKCQQKLKLTQLTFQQRQNRLIQNKRLKIERQKHVQQQQQIKGCTFKPKLTVYRCLSFKKQTQK